MRILLTAGPTYEPIDPVRFVGNHSSGKMGMALADEFAARGHEVTVIRGATSLLPRLKANVIDAPTAQKMYEACMQYFGAHDVIVFAAAVADYTPKTVSDKKIKKTEDEYTITMVKTKDIAAEAGRLKKPGQLTVGFALETDNEAANALGKMQKKNLDFIVLNSMQDAGAGFQHDTNKITIIDKHGNTINFGLKPKSEVAKDIVDYIFKMQAG